MISASYPVRCCAHALFLAAAATLAGCGGGGTSPASLGASQSPPPINTTPVASAQIDAAVDKLDLLAADVMRRTKIPGMAVAVVKGGQVVYAKGFGVRRAGSPERVDADTVFQLASMSKPMAATVVAGLVGNQTVSWDTPAATRLSDFEMSDPAVTRQVTIGDFFAHRSGLPGAAGDKLEDLGYDRQQILQRMRYVPLRAFRTTYGYANFGLTAGAEAAANAAGIDWATLSERTLYAPLGMRATSSRFADFMQRANRASPHVMRDGSYQALYQRQPDAQSPAGGVSSSVNDVAQWLSLLLQNGSYKGRTVVKPEALLPAITGQIVDRPSDDPAVRPNYYGYGFNVGTTTAGRVKLSHSGAFMLGAGTAFTVIPATGVAIVTLTNAAPVGAAEALNVTFEELVESGASSTDWITLYAQRFLPFYVPEGSLAGQQPPSQPVAALGSNAYAGTYVNSYYGNAVVEASGSALTLKMGPTGAKSFPLRHWSGNSYVFDLSGENAPPGSVARVDFKPGASGVAGSLTMDYYAEDIARGTFTRTP
ncbi:MAG TPA: serine hydrolase [Variovorax sp.]|nr:serine hydrolase [Variovorax sp.]